MEQFLGRVGPALPQAAIGSAPWWAWSVGTPNFKTARAALLAGGVVLIRRLQ